MPATRVRARERVVGLHFRIIDDKYVVYLSVDGELRAARLDRESLEIGRPVTLVSGIRREGLASVGQYDIASNGTLTYVLGDDAAAGRLMMVHPRSNTPQPIPRLAEPAAFLGFHLSPDERRLAVVVQARDGQELATTTSLKDEAIHGFMRQSSALSPGVRAETVFAVKAARRARGRVSEHRAPDTVILGTRSSPSPSPYMWRSDSLLLVFARGGILSLNPRSRAPVLDTVAHTIGGYFPHISPDGRFLLEGSPSGGSTIAPIRSGNRVSRIPGANQARGSR